MSPIFDPVLDEISSILRADPEILKALLADTHRAQAFEKLKASFQKKAADKKIQDNTYFAALDFSALMKQDRLLQSFIAHREKVIEILTREAKQLSQTLKEREEAYYRFEAAAETQKKQASPELGQAQILLAEAHECESMLQNLIDQSNTLEDRLNNFEKDEFRPGLQAAAKKIGQDMAEVFKEMADTLPKEGFVTPAEAISLFEEKQANLATVEQLRARTQRTELTDEVICERVPVFTQISLFGVFRSIGIGIKEAMQLANSERGQQWVNDFSDLYKSLHSDNLNIENQQFELALGIKAAENHLNFLNDKISAHTVKHSQSLEDKDSLENSEPRASFRFK